MIRPRIIDLIKQLVAAAILLQLCWWPAWGLDPGKNVDQYLVDRWEMADGIPSNTILSIAQTPDGYLWIVTAKDLVRFDGIKFAVISLAEKANIEPLESITPKTLFVDRKGTLWLGSSGVLTAYYSQKGRFTSFTAVNGLTGGRIRRINEDMRGNLWISFFAGYVNRFSNGEFKEFNASHGLGGKRINAIVEDQMGNLLFGTRENGVFVYKNGKFFKYPVPGLENFKINTMHEDLQGDLWIGTNNALFKVSGKRIETYTAKDGLSNNYITCIREDSDRNLWIGTLKGLNRAQKKQDGTVVFAGLLKSIIISCLLEDNEKNLWVGTDNSGLIRLKDGKFISYAPLEAYREEIFLSVFEDRHGDTWLGTLSGKLFRCRGSDVVESLAPPELSGIGIAAIAEDSKGNLWIGTNGSGVFQKKKDTFVQSTTQDGLTDNMVTSIYRDSRDNLWLSTFDGVSVSRYPDGVFQSFTSRDGLSGRVVHNVYEDKSRNIWIAADKGITVLEEGKITKEKAVFYLEDISVTCIYEDPSAPDHEGKVYWIATDGAGLKRLRLTDGTVTSYTTVQGMTTNFIYQFFEDRQGNFWLMSDSGILRIDKTELNRFAAGGRDKINCISFGIPDGMKSLEFHNEFSGNSALNARTNELWFVTKKGISIVNPEKIRINKLAPPVLLETVLFDRQPIPLHRDTGTYTFKGTTDFSFHFTAPTFLSPEKITFKYRLEGFEKEWVFLAPGTERIAHYTNLEPGTYTFQVTACNAEGVWNQTGDAVTFTLKPFFYQTLVFKLALLLLAAIFLIVAVYIYKKRPFENKVKYKDSPLNPVFAQECIKKLNRLMEEEKVYCDPDISLQSLANRISIPHYQLSQILNETLNRNFFDFINYHRIQEAKRILATPRGAKKKNTVLADQLGFNTMVAFYKAFKKYTDKTPNQYRKELKKKKKL